MRQLVKVGIQLLPSLRLSKVATIVAIVCRGCVEANAALAVDIA